MGLMKKVLAVVFGIVLLVIVAGVLAGMNLPTSDTTTDTTTDTRTPPQFGVADLPPGWEPLSDYGTPSPEGFVTGYGKSFEFRDSEIDPEENQGWLRFFDITVMVFDNHSSAMNYYAVERLRDFSYGGDVSKNVCEGNETIDEDGPYCSFTHPFADRRSSELWYVYGIKGNVFYSFRMEWKRIVDFGMDPLDIRHTLVAQIAG